MGQVSSVFREPAERVLQFRRFFNDMTMARSSSRSPA
jgi:hypothetical protein